MDKVMAEEQESWRKIERLLLDRKAAIDTEINGVIKESEQFQHYLSAYHGEIDPHEMFTNVRLQEQQFLIGSFRFKQLEKITKQLQQPYFTRVDFLFGGEQTAEVIYIGNFSFAAEDGELVIYDWRAPIASVFYDFDSGKAHYQAPNGMIHGEIIRKRQIKFEQGTITYAIETEATIFDEVLQKELAHQKSGKMSTIIRTIQKEQSKIIRNKDTKDMIIQGVAGSGKTSIALHRIAFLLYQLRDQLVSSEILILSPNKVFAEYISEVLPELGEDPVKEFSIDDFVATMTGIQPTISRLEETECLMEEGKAAEQLTYLGSSDCVNDLTVFLDRLNKTGFQPKPISIGDYEFNEQYLLRRFKGYQSRPIFERVDRIAEDIVEELATKPFKPKKMPTVRGISKRLRKMLRYRSPIEAWDAFMSEHLSAYVRSNSYSTLFVLAYIQLFFEERPLLTTINYLVIDEMQDYTPIQIRVLRRAFHCPVLVIGDYTQQISGKNEMTLSGLAEVFPKANVMNLTTSYRSTYEIMMFAKKIIADEVIQPMTRHGEEPETIVVDSLEEEHGELLKTIEEWRQKGLQIALITKTQKQAKEWYERLKDDTAITLLHEAALALDVHGVVLCSVAISKGLEFEAVIGIETQEENFRGASGNQQLFVIATRAMHFLRFIERKGVQR